MKGLLRPQLIAQCIEYSGCQYQIGPAPKLMLIGGKSKYLKFLKIETCNVNNIVNVN